MSRIHLILSLVAVLIAGVGVSTAIAQVPHVISVSPPENALNIQPTSDIAVTFDTEMDQSTIDFSSFLVFTRSTGSVQGAISYDNGTKTALFDPSSDFHLGENVTVILTAEVESSDGIPMESGYLWSFSTVVDNGDGVFVPSSALDVGSAPYSGSAADLDGDGNVDLVTASSSFDNVSVLLNNGDGSFAASVEYGTGEDPRSVFAADFDGDGYPLL
jgi:hypothetical protein